MIKISKISQNKCIFRSPESSWTFLEIFSNILRNFFDHSSDSFRTFPGIFLKIPLNLLERSLEPFRTFHPIFSNFPRNLLEHSPELSWTFLWISFLLNLFSFIRMSKKDTWSKVISGNTTIIGFLLCPTKYFPKI